MRTPPELRRLDLRSGLRFAATFLVVSLLSACAPSTSTQPTPPGATSASAGSLATPAAGRAPIVVLGTENFYADLLAEIGGERVQATSFINDPNADPHEFEANPQDAAIVADAELVI